MKPHNPFLITSYHSPEYFCDRRKETEDMISALRNGRNLTLISLRRMGKTGLIQHVFNHLKKKKEAPCIYMDILPTANLNDFVIQFSKSVLGKLESTPLRLMKKVGDFFSYLTPSITYDPLTNQPSVEFSLSAPQHGERTLDQVFRYLEKQDKRIVIAIDEFQQILNYPEKNTEALLRSYIQRANNISFIFSGSHKHMMLSIFSSHARPFYQSTEFLHLGPVSEKDYIKFVASRFRKDKRSIDAEVIGEVIGWCRSHTYYVQYAFNKIFALNEKRTGPEMVRNTLLTILKENEPFYYSYRRLLTDYQWQLLKAIAREKDVRMPTSKTFIGQHGLGTPSSVKTALSALIDKELVYEEDGNYRVYDVFFSRWLERQ
jgi:uncharacterized protein